MIISKWYIGGDGQRGDGHGGHGGDDHGSGGGDGHGELYVLDHN